MTQGKVIMVLQYLLLSIPLRQYKIRDLCGILQYHFSSIYSKLCSDFILKKLNKIVM